MRIRKLKLIAADLGGHLTVEARGPDSSFGVYDWEIAGSLRNPICSTSFKSYGQPSLYTFKTAARAAKQDYQPRAQCAKRIKPEVPERSRPQDCRISYRKMEFDRAGQASMKADLIALLQQLCEIDPPEISQQWIVRHESKESIEALISCGALVPAENASLVLCEQCDQEHWIVPEYLERGQFRGFCQHSGYHQSCPKPLRCFVVDESLDRERYCCGFGHSAEKSRLDKSSAAVRFGRAKFGPYPASCSLAGAFMIGRG